MKSIALLWKILSTSFVLLSSSSFSQAEPDFNRDVRPILAGHCFECHGPDQDQRKAKLRLDQPSAENRRLIHSNADSSALLERVFSHDPDELMPPPEVKNPLSETQKDVLRRWIDAGAVYEPHWAFQPPRAKAPPRDVDLEKARHPVDAFILRRLEQNGRSLSEKADPFTLVRRVYLDLLGFPPSPEEAEAYVRDPSPNADERLLDRLLASPAYGERWGRRWLDLARYADTNGYEKDRPRSIWPYRDWVIDAINADLPFDQFTIDQLAGDLLPDATPAQRIATGFHRNTMLNEEGGIDPLEYRFHSLVDRVNTTSTVWLGLTMGCAQCHTHKFDPIDHRDYFAMMAFLNNADEPEMALPDEDIQDQRRALNTQIAALEADLPEQFPAGHFFAEHLRTWFDSHAAEVVVWENVRPSVAQANLAKLDQLKDDSILARGDQSKRDVYDLTFEGDWNGVTAFRLEALPHPSLPKSGPGRAYYEGPQGDFFLSEIQLDLAGTSVPLTNATESYAKLGIGGGRGVAAEAIDGNEVTGWSTSGREGEAHHAVFQTVAPLENSGQLGLRLIFNRHYPASLGRFRVAITRNPRPAKAQPFPVGDEALFHQSFENLSAAERARLEKLFCQHTPLLAEAREKIEKLRRSLPEFPGTLVFHERPEDNRRTTYRHHRGEFLQAKEPVTPAVPDIFPQLPEGVPLNRLNFARWLVSERNPLASRAQVNRDWAAFFGQSIVRTPGDFGYQGASPTHPELLDWLAVDFAAWGWSRKRFHRALAGSAVYQQASRTGQASYAGNPENRLLGRGARFRIEAELVRDTALRAAGLLTHKVGGPSVFPPQPANITTEGAYGQLTWDVSEGEDRYRRGLYTFAKRTSPYAMFTTFDAGSGEACLERREITNTPLQALTTWNDTSLVEAAQVLGKTIAGQSPTPLHQVQDLFRRILTRPPDEQEIQWMLEFFERQRAKFEQAPDLARQLAGVETSGEAVVAEAGWTALARVLLNLDETFLHH